MLVVGVTTSFLLRHRSPPPVGPTDEDACLVSPTFATMPTLRKRRRHSNAQPLILPSSEFDEPTKTRKHATGFRKDLTADNLTLLHAPTCKKRPFPCRTAAAHDSNDLMKPLTVSSSQNSGSDESVNEGDDEPHKAVDVGTSSRRAGVEMDRMKYGVDNDGGATMIDLDPEEGA